MGFQIFKSVHQTVYWILLVVLHYKKLED